MLRGKVFIKENLLYTVIEENLTEKELICRSTLGDIIKVKIGEYKLEDEGSLYQYLVDTSKGTILLNIKNIILNSNIEPEFYEDFIEDIKNILIKEEYRLSILEEYLSSKDNVMELLKVSNNKDNNMYFALCLFDESDKDYKYPILSIDIILKK